MSTRPRPCRCVAPGARHPIAFALVLALSALGALPHAAHGQQAALDSLRDVFELPGVSAAVVLPGGETAVFVSGVAAPDTPLEPGMLFEVGSVTKTYTAALVLKLVESGALDLDAPVTRWKPDFPHAEGVTIRHLLRHTSGLHNHSENPAYIPALRSDFTRTWKPEDSFAFMEDPYFAPGEGWHYSNANYLLLGQIVEAVAGSSYSAALRERVLDPAGLLHTYVDVDESPSEPRAHAFLDIDGDGTAEDLSALVPNTSFMSAGWAAGAIVATAEDLALWAHRLYGGRFLADESLTAMTDWVERGDGMQYGLGTVRYTTPSGRELWGHKGNTVGYSAGVWHDPARDVTIAVLANGHAVDVTPIAVALLEALEPAASGAPDPVSRP
jgi:D-alanyl-D-alanine carboxypeptidase